MSRKLDLQGACWKSFTVPGAAMALWTFCRYCWPMEQDFLHRAICRWMPDLWQDLTTFLASRKLLGTLSGSQSMQRPSSFWPLLEIHTDEYIRCTQSHASWHTPWLLFLYSFAPKWGEELREGMGWFQVKTLALWDLDDLWTIWM